MNFEEYIETVEDQIWFKIALRIDDYLEDAWNTAYKQGFDDGYDSCQDQRSLLDKEDE